MKHVIIGAVIVGLVVGFVLAFSIDKIQLDGAIAGVGVVGILISLTSIFVIILHPAKMSKGCSDKYSNPFSM